MKNLPFRNPVLASLLLFFGLICTASHIAHAQQKPTGYLGQGKDRYSVFVFGDALAGGLWAGSARVTKSHPRIALNGRYREGSGLARPQIYDWSTRLPATLENRKIDIAIIFIGTNDAQDIRRKDEYLVFNSPQWREAYAASVRLMINQLLEHKAAIYWVETPPVRRRELDDRLKIIGNIQRQEAEKAGVRFIDTRKIFTTTGNEYTDAGSDIYGNVVRLRARNGIRFIKAGNTKLAHAIFQQIDRDIEIADGDRPVSDFPLPKGAKLAGGNAPKYFGPLFAGSDATGNAIIIEPRGIDVSDPTATALSGPSFGGQGGTIAGPTGDHALEALRSDTKPGTPAHNLFVEGIWATGPSSRVDSFSNSGK